MTANSHLTTQVLQHSPHALLSFFSLHNIKTGTGRGLGKTRPALKTSRTIDSDSSTLTKNSAKKDVTPALSEELLILDTTKIEVAITWSNYIFIQ